MAQSWPWGSQKQQLKKKVAETVLDSYFVSEQITFMIYTVKILLVCCANYMKSYYICKVIFMLPDINLLETLKNLS